MSNKFIVIKLIPNFKREKVMSFTEYFNEINTSELETMKNETLSWRTKGLISAGLTLDFVTVIDNTIYAAGVKNNDISHILDPLLSLLQQFALPIAIIAGLWGCIEYISGKPSGVDKIKKAIIGLIAIYVIPYIFRTIASSLASYSGR